MRSSPMRKFSQRTLRLRAPVAVRRNLDRPERVGFGAGLRHGPSFIRKRQRTSYNSAWSYRPRWIVVRRRPAAHAAAWGLGALSRVAHEFGHGMAPGGLRGAIHRRPQHAWRVCTAQRARPDPPRADRQCGELPEGRPATGKADASLSARGLLTADGGHGACSAVPLRRCSSRRASPAYLRADGRLGRRDAGALGGPCGNWHRRRRRARDDGADLRHYLAHGVQPRDRDAGRGDG